MGWGLHRATQGVLDSHVMGPTPALSPTSHVILSKWLSPPGLTLLQQSAGVTSAELPGPGGHDSLQF